MNTSNTSESSKFSDSADGGFLSFSKSNDNSTSNWQKNPFKSHSPYHNRQQINEQFSPQGFSSPIHNKRNFIGNRNQSGNHGERFRGNQSYNRGNNWKTHGDNRKVSTKKC